MSQELVLIEVQLAENGSLEAVAVLVWVMDTVGDGIHEAWELLHVVPTGHVTTIFVQPPQLLPSLDSVIVPVSPVELLSAQARAE